MNLYIAVVFNIDEIINFFKTEVGTFSGWNISELTRMCSVNVFTNLLVEADIYFHFSGIILCNKKLLQLNWYLKKYIVAQSASILFKYVVFF